MLVWRGALVVLVFLQASEFHATPDSDLLESALRSMKETARSGASHWRALRQAARRARRDVQVVTDYMTRPGAALMRFTFLSSFRGLFFLRSRTQVRLAC